MAHVFVGNAPKANTELLNAFLGLDDSFWVFSEFNVGSGAGARQVDWLIMRAVPDERPFELFSTMIVGELKESTAAFTGLVNNQWTEERNGSQSLITMSNRLDQNPLQQAINIGNAVKEWLWNHERLFIDLDRPQLDSREFSMWPTLVILSPPEVQHRLPHRLSYGSIWYGVDEWLGAVKSWTPKRGLQLTAAELARLAGVIADSSGMEPWGLTTSEGGVAPPSTRPAPPQTPPITQRPPFGIIQDADRQVDARDIAADPPDLVHPEPESISDPFPVASLGWLQELATWVAATERRLDRLEQGLTPQRPSPLRLSVRADDTYTPDERALVERALNQVRYRSGNRDFPTVFAEMHRVLGGDSLSRRNFLGWGSGRIMMDQAVAEGWLAYGPVDRNGLPTLYFPDERA